MAFRGWPAEAVEFFQGLEADNSKAYWQANKETYERAARHPMEELLAELAPEFGPGRIFRPNRDMRFSKDKAPYKTNLAARVGGAGYVSLSSAGLTAGAGMVHVAADQLDRYRRAVDDHQTGPVLEAAVVAIREAGHQCAPHEALKTAPKGYSRDHPRVVLLRAKGIIMWHDWPAAAWLGTRRAKERIVDVLRTSEPLTRWLADHVGETSTDPRRTV